MNFSFSRMGEALGGPSGISELMDDLGQALATGGPHIKMLGGGQPAQIAEMNDHWRQRLEELMESVGGLESMLSQYDPPRGNPHFCRALASMLARQFGWPVTEENVAVTSGGQTAFFFLFHLLAGTMPDGRRKKILLPLVPEYIGYANQSVEGEMFQAYRPLIEHTGEHEFKYRVDFEKLKITDEIAAICVSRPTNPTGNVLTDEEIGKLSDLARQHGIPLIIDNAYGAPFPNIIFEDATPVWEPHIILTLSLSKIGLPGVRTGMVVAHPDVAVALGNMSAVVGLANPNMGQRIALPLLESGELLRLSNEVVRPFYVEKSAFARRTVHEVFGERFPWLHHRSEGALFLWLWFPEMPISSKELYERLKKRGVLIISGHYFFFGMGEGADWRHQQECIRMTFTMSEEIVRDGIAIIAEEVERAWRENVRED